jgi:hypothetical protein
MKHFTCKPGPQISVTKNYTLDVSLDGAVDVMVSVRRNGGLNDLNRLN